MVKLQFVNVSNLLYERLMRIWELICRNDGTCCLAIICDHPTSIENGRVIIVNNTRTYNSAVEYHCIPHYQRVGPYLRKCMDNGRWSGDEPRCECKFSLQKYQCMAWNRINFWIYILVAKADGRESQTVGFVISIGIGAILFLLFLLGVIYLKL